MAAKLEEITVVYRRERPGCRWGETAIVECDPVDAAENGKPKSPKLGFDLDAGGITCKIESQPDELVRGLSYHLYGRWQEHERHGRQFIAKTWIRSQPHGREGTIRYLQQAPGVGKATAAKLWEKFQGDAVRILREQPDVATAAVDVIGFNEEKAKAAAAFLVEEKALENVSIDLIDLFAGRGFPKATMKSAVAEWGNQAAAKIKRNPYLLMRFRGCGFLRTDALYLDMGGNPAAIKRQSLSAWYAIARDTDGHTWHKPETAKAGIRSKVSGATVDPLKALILAKRARLLSVHRNGDGRVWVAESKKADNERTVAEHVRFMLSNAGEWPAAAELPDVSDHQRGELVKALVNRVAILAGSPGTGKTFAAARLIAAIIAAHGAGQVAVAAPTGKAAVRITEALQGYGINMQASTIHRLLGVAARTEGEGWEFLHDESNPLEFRFIIVDESSMIDTDLMAALLRACGPSTHVLFVGDTNQLPPVGHGAPLRDMIAAGVPCGELTEIRRNAGQIVRACADIRDGKRWLTCETIDPETGDNLKLIQTGSNAASVNKISATIHKLGAAGFDPVWDVQVIVAVNKKSELSRRDLNKRLQGELNAAGERAGSNPFRVGDKIVCLKNSLTPIVEDAAPEFNKEAIDNKVFVANGEIGRVVAVAEKLTTVRLDSPLRLVKIPRGGGDNQDDSDGNGNGDGKEDAAATDTGCQWDLAYAISCHKSQGSEFPVVIVALDEYPGARMICTREWLYTALSRAKKICLMIGKRAIADSMCLTRAIAKRKTFLKELIQGGA